MVQQCERYSIFVDAVRQNIREKTERICFDEEAVVAELKRKKHSESDTALAAAQRQLQAVRQRPRGA
jgi:hypothetical protein